VKWLLSGRFLWTFVLPRESEALGFQRWPKRARGQCNSVTAYWIHQSYT